MPTPTPTAAQFQPRFNIPIIGEFYGATESNIMLFSKVDQSGIGRGAVGRMGYLMRCGAFSAHRHGDAQRTACGSSPRTRAQDHRRRTSF